MPVGLVVDDIGPFSGEWDELSSQVLRTQGRGCSQRSTEEDARSLTSARADCIVRPRLDASLAEGLWDELASASSLPLGWHEAFDDTDGLLLEYVFFLTTGDRLDSTIAGQVEQRRKDDAELDILRIVSVAAEYGGAIDVRRLGATLSIKDLDLQRALARLVDEHMVSDPAAGHIGGLHRLRSQAISPSMPRHTTLPPQRLDHGCPRNSVG